MKRVLFLLAPVVLTGCDDAVRLRDGREYECVGVNEERAPHVRYAIDKSNVAVALVLAETIVVPVVVALDQLWCPVGLDSATTPAMGAVR